MVLTMAYTLFERERLLDYAIFDSYPNPLPQVKRRCNDPVLGDGYMGCFKKSILDHNINGFVQQSLSSVTPEKCVVHCKSKMLPYAALSKGNRCYCGVNLKSAKKVKECECRKKCKGVKKKLRCGGSHHVSLYNTYVCTKEMKEARAIDGTCNDLNNTTAGSRLYRFGRNVPLKHVYTNPGDLLKPDPRTLAKNLLQRKKFIEVPWLNLFAVAWLQFMVHDWFDHSAATEEKIEVPLAKDDPLYKKMKGKLKVRRTKPDPCENKNDAVPPAYQNHVTHWWDGSQLYGSDRKTHDRVRSFVDGKLNVDDEGFLPLDPKSNIDITGMSKNWWSGLSLLHNLFTREHNSICDMLMENHPAWKGQDERLFQTARLINTAQIVQIHTLEWTGAILNTDFINESLIGQWYGKLSPRVIKMLQEMNITLGSNSFPSHQKNPPDYRGVPFSLTEEFVAVYRMHSLLPDYLNIRRMTTGQLKGKKYSLPKYSFGNARKVFDENELDDILYTFGVEKAGQLVLHNYPNELMKLKIPKHQGGELVDLATIDILRDRERGVPRYNQFRRLLNLTVPDTFEKLTNDTATAAELRQAYNGKIEDVDLLIGSLAEARPEGFGFGDTPFHLFLCMANRRLRTDRFLTIDYKEEYYTKEGLQWVEDSTMKKVLLRNFDNVPGLDNAMRTVTNAFFVWNK